MRRNCPILISRKVVETPCIEYVENVLILTVSAEKLQGDSNME